MRYKSIHVADSTGDGPAYVMWAQKLIIIYYAVPKGEIRLRGEYLGERICGSRTVLRIGSL